MFLDHVFAGRGIGRRREFEVSHPDAGRQTRQCVARGWLEGQNQIRPLRFTQANFWDRARLDVICADSCGGGSGFLRPFRMNRGDQQQPQPALVRHG